MLGVTGTGKSTTANTIAGLTESNKFKESAKIKSETHQTSGKLSYWEGKDRNLPIMVIDTPGFQDSENRDTQHIA